MVTAPNTRWLPFWIQDGGNHCGTSRPFKKAARLKSHIFFRSYLHVDKSTFCLFPFSDRRPSGWQIFSLCDVADRSSSFVVLFVFAPPLSCRNFSSFVSTLWLISVAHLRTRILVIIVANVVVRISILWRKCTTKWCIWRKGICFENEWCICMYIRPA